MFSPIAKPLFSGSYFRSSSLGEAFADVAGLPDFAAYPNKITSKWNEILLGVDTSGEDVTWDISAHPHALITGSAGMGKTVFQKNLFLHCLTHPDDWKILGIDIQGRELRSLKKHKDTVLSVAETLDDAVEILRYAENIMNKRYSEMEPQGVLFNNFRKLKDENGKPLPAIMVMIDDALALLALDGGKDEASKADNLNRAQASILIGNIARLGRAAGVFITMTMQRSSAAVIPAETKANLSLRVVAGPVDTMTSMVTLGSAPVLKSFTGKPKGYTVASNVKSKTTEDGLTEFRTFYPSPRRIESLRRKAFRLNLFK